MYKCEATEKDGTVIDTFESEKYIECAVWGDSILLVHDGDITIRIRQESEAKT